MNRRLLGATVVLAGTLTVTVAGQQGLPPSGPEAPLFTVSSELVVLQVIVEDRQGRDVANLTSDAFTVFEDGKAQSIAFFNRQDAPATIGVLVDSSGSMREVRDLVTSAAATFTERSNPEDEIFALVFGDAVRPVLPSDDPFTSDSAVLRRALPDMIVPMGRTALFDAIEQGLAYADGGMHERKVLIVISDGGDNASHASFDHVVRQAQQSNALIYAVLVRDPLETDVNPDPLKRLVQQSGGRVFAPRDVRDMPELLAHVARDIRNMYTLGYSPADDKGPGLRRLRVRVIDHDGASLRVRTRDGYRVGNTR